MKKLFLSLFLSLFLFSCQTQYQDHYQKSQKQTLLQKEVDKNIDNFSFQDIKTLSGISIKETPDLEFLNDLVGKIDKSQKRVYVEVYIFTEKRLSKALIDAKKRGIDVKVLLEKNVYMAPSLNKKMYDSFLKAGIDVKYSNPENYSLNHTKMMIIDDEAVISTGNYSYSTFKKNREFFVFIKDKDFFNVLLEIFLADFSLEKQIFYHPNLVLSPFYSKDKMQYLIKNAKKDIKIYSHNFGDDEMEKIIIQAKNNGKNVKMVFPSLKKVASNEDEINRLKSKGIEIKQLSKPEIHAKTILVDEKYLYIGSINFSTPSMTKNREIGILISNPEIIKYFLEVFNKDFSKGD